MPQCSGAFTTSAKHRQYLSSHPLQPKARFRRQSLHGSSSGIRVDHVEHGFPQPPVAKPKPPLPFPCSLSGKLPVEILDGAQGVCNWTLKGQFQAILLVAQPICHSFEHLGQFSYDLRGDMPIGGGDFGFGNHPICADQAQDERRHRQTGQTNLRICDGNSRGHFVPVDLELPAVRYGKQHELCIMVALTWVSGPYPIESKRAKISKLSTGLYLGVKIARISSPSNRTNSCSRFSCFIQWFIWLACNSGGHFWQIVEGNSQSPCNRPLSNGSQSVALIFYFHRIQRFERYSRHINQLIVQSSCSGHQLGLILQRV